MGNCHQIQLTSDFSDDISDIYNYIKKDSIYYATFPFNTFINITIKIAKHINNPINLLLFFTTFKILSFIFFHLFNQLTIASTNTIKVINVNIPVNTPNKSIKTSPTLAFLPGTKY